MSGSEIARLRRRLEDEYTAGRRALYGLASGWAKHQFISRRLSNMDDCRLELERLVGKEEAMRIVCETLEAAREVERQHARVDCKRQASAEVLHFPRPGSSEPGKEEQAHEQPFGGAPVPLEAPRLQGDDRAIEKTLWLLAYRSREEDADILYLFYAACQEEVELVTYARLSRAGDGATMLMLRQLPHGFGVPYGRYRGMIHVRLDGSIVEGNYLIERSIAQD